MRRRMFRVRGFDRFTKDQAVKERQKIIVLFHDLYVSNRGDFWRGSHIVVSPQAMSSMIFNYTIASTYRLASYLKL